MRPGKCRGKACLVPTLDLAQCIGEKLAGTMILFSWLTRPGAPEGH